MTESDQRGYEKIERSMAAQNSGKDRRKEDTYDRPRSPMVVPLREEAIISPPLGSFEKVRVVGSAFGASFNNCEIHKRE